MQWVQVQQVRVCAHPAPGTMLAQSSAGGSSWRRGKGQGGRHQMRTFHSKGAGAVVQRVKPPSAVQPSHTGTGPPV